MYCFWKLVLLIDCFFFINLIHQYIERQGLYAIFWHIFNCMHIQSFSRQIWHITKELTFIICKHNHTQLILSLLLSTQSFFFYFWIRSWGLLSNGLSFYLEKKNARCYTLIWMNYSLLFKTRLMTIILPIMSIKFWLCVFFCYFPTH